MLHAWLHPRYSSASKKSVDLFSFVKVMNLFRTRINIDPGFRAFKEGIKILKESTFPFMLQVVTDQRIHGRRVFVFSYDNGYHVAFARNVSKTIPLAIGTTPIDYLVKFMASSEKEIRRSYRGNSAYDLYTTTAMHLIEQISLKLGSFVGKITMYNLDTHRSTYPIKETIRKAPLQKAMVNAVASPYTLLGKRRLEKEFSAMTNRKNGKRPRSK